jgi:hypothetical protein
MLVSALDLREQVTSFFFGKKHQVVELVRDWYLSAAHACQFSSRAES